MTLVTRSLVVLAKQPLPGRAKTRLQAGFSAVEAAQLAAAALDDTLAAVRRARVERRILAFDGDAMGYDRGFDVVPQPTGSMTDRLAAAMTATRAVWPGFAGRHGHAAGDTEPAGGRFQRSGRPAGIE